MPFRIIRNDITKVKADIIVNTANPKPTYGYGTDSAIFYAAGKEQLLAARKEIGCINFGDIAVTSAFSLKAKYIIHTVGPVWIDGNNNEFVTLKSCYEKSLKKAIELKAESIAFPLIATGVYGFPKDKALQIAISVFSEFLVNNDIEIILVVYDKKAYELSSNIMGDIESFIDNNYVQEERMLARCMSDSTLVISSIERRQFLNQEKPALVSNNEIQPYDSLFSSDNSFTDAGESFIKSYLN